MRLLSQRRLTTRRIRNIFVFAVVPFHGGMNPLALSSIRGFLPIHCFQRMERRAVDMTPIFPRRGYRFERLAGCVFGRVRDAKTSSLAAKGTGVTRSRR